MHSPAASPQRQSKHKRSCYTLPTSVTEKQFVEFFLPSLSLPRRSKKLKVPLWRIFNHILYQLHTGCQWDRVSIPVDPATGKKEISHTSVWKWFDRWSSDGSFERALIASVARLHRRGRLRTKRINLDGTNSVAKKGGMPSDTVGTSTRRESKR